MKQRYQKLCSATLSSTALPRHSLKVHVWDLQLIQQYLSDNLSFILCMGSKSKTNLEKCIFHWPFLLFQSFEDGPYIISLISHEPLPPTQTVLLVRLVEVSKHWKSMPYFVIFKCLFTWVIAVCHFAAFKFRTGKKVNNFRESLVQRTCFVMLSLRNLKFRRTWS